MRVALGQISSQLGNFKLNAEKILAFTNSAKERRCNLVVFPEMALFGYPPGDILERQAVVKEQLKYLIWLSKKIPSEITVLVGAVTLNPNKRGRRYFNSAVLLQKSKKPKFFHKELLPTYDIFDEYRYFEFGDVLNNVIKIENKNCLITVCEDIWSWEDTWDGHCPYTHNPLDKIKGKKIDLVLNLSASPFSQKKHARRLKAAHNVVKKFKAPLVYVNTVGAQDEILFDGSSFAMNKKGKIIAQNVLFEEDLNVFDLKKEEGGIRNTLSSKDESLRQALVMGIREFVHKNGFEKVHLGVSGGIDSALVLCLAVDALGPQRVRGVALPGPFNAPESLAWAQKLCKNLGVDFYEFGISSAYEDILKSIDKELGPLPFGLVNENLQSRLRGIFLMALSNHWKSLLLTTSNKSELATGYSTLYGDLCGGLLPIGDLLKKEVYNLCRYYNREQELIPQGILDRPPSAELKPNQKDQDTLPPYDELDKIVQKIVTDLKPAVSETEVWVLKQLYHSEFKRWQAPPILRVSDRAFGKGRRYPISNSIKL